MGIFQKVMLKFGYAPVSVLGAAPEMLAALEATKRYMKEQYVEEEGLPVWVTVNRAIASAKRGDANK